MPTINGTAENDTLNGTAENDTIYGFAGNDIIYGFAGGDFLYGGGGNDTLDGGTGLDTMKGGGGNDTYVVDDASDETVESNATGGTDLVKSYVSRTLGANLENLKLLGSAAINGTGNSLANIITGNSAANVLTGRGGNDTLYGGGGNDTLDGGTGLDTMKGGGGNDTYVVDDASDETVESSATGGTDLVKSYVSRTLGANLENLKLLGNAAINGTGNSLDNTITGNSANNVLEGGAGNDVLIGGTGDDTMAGGAGDDIYYIESRSDAVTENSAEGIDTVRVTTQDDPVNGYYEYFMPENVENGIFTGVEAAVVHGNALDNLLVGTDHADVLIGEGGNDTLRGGAGGDNLYGSDGNDILNGGTGADYLQGLLGDDTYYVDDAGDSIDEFGGGGVDTVVTSLGTYTLPSVIENGERLTPGSLTGNNLANSLNGSSGSDTLDGGFGNDQLVGGNGDDTLNGGSENDVLVGGGGADTLSGGTYGDQFVYNRVTDSSEATGVDEILGFEGETIDLGAIDANASVAGNQAFVWGDTTAAAYSVWVHQDVPGHYFVYADTNGDALPDLTISVTVASGSVGEYNFVL